MFGLRVVVLTILLFIESTVGQIIRNQLPTGSSFGVPNENATYDYIVVGGGTAGLTIATRLAQDGRYSVAVIEAGGLPQIENGNRSIIPGYDFYSNALTLEGVNPLIDWQFFTTPQTGAAGRSIHYARGKTLGGSSARNYMVYQRPTVGFFKKWADEIDDQSWTWANLFQFYKRSTTVDAPNSVRLANSTPVYNASDFDNGPLQVSWPNYVSGLGSWLARALQESGLSVLPRNVVGGTLLGYAHLSHSIDGKSQERSFAGNAFLELALTQTQLIIYTHTLATKVLFDQTKRANAVRVETETVPYTLTARREIILSAGAVQSPQLLMVSGVGPAATLNKYKIPVVADRPGVGQNLQDNPFFGISYPVNVETASVYQTNPARLQAAVAAYNTNRTGYLTTSGADILSFHKAANFTNVTLSAQARKDLASFPADWPDVEILGFPVYFGPVLLGAQPDLQNYGGIAGSLTAPLSRGFISINSSSIRDAPIINPNWLAHPTDQEVAVATVRRMRQLAQTKAFSSIVLGPGTYPGPNATSDAAILAAIQLQTTCLYHVAGSCKMGRTSDPQAVVDSRARVIGVSSLRVVDLSAVPYLPPGQPQASAYMLGEKIAYEILRGN